MVDDVGVLIVGVDGAALEAECVAQEVDRARRILVSKDGIMAGLTGMAVLLSRRLGRLLRPAKLACLSVPPRLYGRSFQPLEISRTARPIGLPWLFPNALKETKMPKLKTKSGVKKRFKLTATGKIKHGVAGKRHRLISHNAKYIRQNRGTDVLADADTARVKLWAPYGLR
jgi:large subunit ribosomal protein L35